MDTRANDVWSIGRFFGVDGRALLRQYRDFQSGFKDWNQKSHAKKWLLYPENLGSHLSIDQTSLSRGELYTILTNKAAKGGLGSIVAIVAGTKAETVIEVLRKIPEIQRKKVTEITLDMAGSMTVRRRGNDCQAMLSAGYTCYGSFPRTTVGHRSLTGNTHKAPLGSFRPRK